MVYLKNPKNIYSKVILKNISKLHGNGRVFFLSIGLKITKRCEFIKFYPQKCFAKLADKIVNSQREDVDNSKAVIPLIHVF